jgi:hypothetical protein
MPAPRDQGVPVNVTQSLSIQYVGAAPAVAGTLLDWAGNVATGAAPIFGVLREDATTGRWVSVAVAGLAEVLSGAALSAGNSVGADATGRGVSLAPGSQTLGRIIQGSTATAAGQRVQMLITREGTN